MIKFHYKNFLDQDSVKDIEYISNSFKKSAKIYIVGGAVRDMLLGHKIKDIDLEIHNISKDSFINTLKKIGATGVGKSFFVYKYKNIDISLPRVEKKVSLGHKGFEVKICQDLKLSTLRRDFTINSMMIDVKSGLFVDFHNGLRDIRDKTLRIVNKKSFSEDSLRVLRAMRFCAQLGFKCDSDSILIMKKIELDDISKERIFLEFKKMFVSRFPHYGLYYLFKLDIAYKIINISKLDNFFGCMLELVRGREHFEEEIKEFYFLFILSKYIDGSLMDFVEPLGLPNSYKKLYKKQYITKDISKREIFIASLNLPIRFWLENYKPFVKKIAKKCNIYDDKYRSKVNALDVVNDGFYKEEIKEEYNRRVLKEIDELLENECKNI